MMFRGITMLGLGAGLMYIFDPDKGRQRRASLRDQLDHCTHELEEAIEKGTRDLRNRGQGFFAELEGALVPDHAPDRVIEARVRSELGRYVSHPGAIETRVDQGRVRLSGPILAQEVNDLLEAIRCVRGVRGLDNRLEVHEQPGRVSALQGTGRRLAQRSEAVEDRWMPGPRLLAGASGGFLALLGTVRGGVSGVAMSALGVGLLSRSFTNAPLSETFAPERLTQIVEPVQERLGLLEQR